MSRLENDGGKFAYQPGHAGAAVMIDPTEQEIEALEVSALAASMPANVTAAAILQFCRGERLAQRVLDEVLPCSNTESRQTGPSGLEPAVVGSSRHRRSIIGAALTAALMRLVRTELGSRFDGMILHFVATHSDNVFGRCAESLSRVTAACGLDPQKRNDRQQLHSTS